MQLFTFGKGRPRGLILAGVHGDEYEPILAARRLSKMLATMPLRGSAQIVSLVNESAFALRARCAEDGLDLARTFPGRAGGSVTQRIAHEVSALICDADFLIDLHTGGIALQLAPLSGYMMHADKSVLEKQREMARAFNLPLVWGSSPMLNGRTLSVARDADIPAIYAECGGGLTLAIARGYEVVARHRSGADAGSTPRIECAQPAGNDTIASPLREGLERARAVVCTSQISGLQVASVIDGNETIAACRASGDSGHVVSDEEIWAAQRAMAREEGLWCEPAGAVALAAALRARRENRIEKGARVVCLVTGGGWKDEASLQILAGAAPETRVVN